MKKLMMIAVVVLAGCGWVKDAAAYVQERSGKYYVQRGLKMKITREQYAAAIPKCCAYQSIEAHESIMLCWGLARAVEKGLEMSCDNCTENTMKLGADKTGEAG